MKNVTTAAEIFATKIKELRISQGLSLKALGKAVGVSGVAIGRWERKTRIPTIETLILFANYFNVSTDYLLGRE